MNCGLSFDMLSDQIRAVSLEKNDKFRVCVINYTDSVLVGNQILYFANTSFVCLCQSASLLCDSNPVVASQARFAVYRMKRRICANLNLIYF